VVDKFFIRDFAPLPSLIPLTKIRRTPIEELGIRSEELGIEEDY